MCLTFGDWGGAGVGVGEGGGVQVSQLAWQRYLWRAASVIQRSAQAAGGGVCVWGGSQVAYRPPGSPL